MEVRSSLPYSLAKWPEAIKKRSCVFFFFFSVLLLYVCLHALTLLSGKFVHLGFFIFTSMMHSSTLEIRGGDHRSTEKSQL